MRAAVTTADASFQLEQVDDPTPGAGELVVAVSGCGICGTDLGAHAAMPEGTVMGHEFSGEVVAVGTDVQDSWREGMRAAVFPIFACGACDWCRVGDPAHCRTPVRVGLGGSPGGFAEYARTSAALSFRLPDALPESWGPLVEPFAVGLHNATSGRIGPGDEVLVIGGGPVGLATVAWAKQLGAARVTLSDPHDNRLHAGLALGATDTIKARTEEVADEYDVVIECIGKPGALDACTAAARTKGRVVVAGVCSQPDPFVPQPALLKELTIAFSVYYLPKEFETVIAAFATERIDPSPLVTRTVGLDAVGTAFKDLTAFRDDIKVVVDPRR